MVYKAFQEVILSELKERLTDGFRVVTHRVPKNNGIILDGVCILPQEESVAPMIYLNQYYERFQNGASLESLADEILRICLTAPCSGIDFPDPDEFEKQKDKVICRIVNSAANAALLRDVPSVPFLDLSVIFCLYLGGSPKGQMTALIHQSHMDAWNVSVDELYALAVKNTPRLLPADLRSMAEVIESMAGCGAEGFPDADVLRELSDCSQSPPLYVLTDCTGMRGAASMLYPGQLKRFAQELDADLIILPSSIHEVLLLPYHNEVRISELEDLVRYVNLHDVPEEDILSDHVYFYSRSSDKTIIAQDPASALAS